MNFTNSDIIEDLKIVAVIAQNVFNVKGDKQKVVFWEGRGSRASVSVFFSAARPQRNIICTVNFSHIYMLVQNNNTTMGHNHEAARAKSLLRTYLRSNSKPITFTRVLLSTSTVIHLQFVLNRLYSAQKMLMVTTDRIVGRGARGTWNHPRLNRHLSLLVVSGVAVIKLPEKQETRVPSSYQIII